MSAAAAVSWRMGSTTILGTAVSDSQYWCTCGADVDGLAPQIITHFEPSMVRGSKPRVDSPYISCSAACPALLHPVPAGRLETARALGPDPLQGTRQARAWITPDPIVPNGTFATQRSPADA